MIGFVRSTVSPSSSIISRSTPWVDGCWGPMLMIIVSSPDTSMSRFRRRVTAALRQTEDGTDLAAQLRRRSLARGRQLLGAFGRLGHEAFVSVVCSLTAVRSSRPGGFLELHRDAPDAVVLAQRVALPVVRHEDPGDVRVAVEDDPEHVVGLALHGLGARVEIPQRVDRRIGSGHLDPYAQLRSAGDTDVEHSRDLETLRLDPVGECAAGMRQVVDAAEIGEELETRPPACRRRPRGTRRVRGSLRRHLASIELSRTGTVGVSLRSAHPDRVRVPRGPSPRAPAVLGAFSGRFVISPVRIFSCRVRIAWSSVSGLGGQPGA